ncbi:MAG: hypothetical protein Kow00127_01580 [Bacteroidales bacterium]
MRQLFRTIGLVAGSLGILFILAGIIGYFVDNFLNVRNFTWFFWAANSFLMMGIFSLVASHSLKE